MCYHCFFNINQMQDADDEDYCDYDDLELDDLAVPVESSAIKSDKLCVCKFCDEIFPYAISNQKDGSFICYSCRLCGKK